MWSFAVLLLLGSACHLTVEAQEILQRKNVDDLTNAEILSLQTSLDKLEHESGADGYQAIAGYHGSPASCDHNGHKVACCIHGMPTFPAWHRLYTVQMERALGRHGLTIGIPFWDWTRPLKHLPRLVSEATFVDADSGRAMTNAWHEGNIEHAQTHTARAVDERLFEKVEPGHHTTLFEGVLDALEQEEYCQFEVQFEVNHNSIHFLTGGRYMHSMSTLEFTSYDPLFFLHHSNVDRIFAIWQELQKARGKPYDHSNCAVNMFQQDLEPFNRAENSDALTKAHAKAATTFDYKQLGYSYEDLTLNDLNVEQLDQLIHDRKGADRLFASFKLGGIGISANVRVNLCLPSNDPNSPDHCEFAGDFFILGGPTEMPWTFFYPYLFDVTKSIHKFEGAHLDSNFYVTAEVQAVNGTSLPEGTLPDPVLIHKPSVGLVDASLHKPDMSKLVTRKSVDQLTREEVYELREAFTRWQQDKSVDGFQAIAEYHGLPARCPSPDAEVRWACCHHGMATFPHWHRLFVTQMEDALVVRGSHVGIPYWDWTLPMTELPHLVADETYQTRDGNVKKNPFYQAHIAHAGKDTTRNLLTDLIFEKPSYGTHTYVFDAMVYAFEQEDFCDFEVQLEVVHNAMHLWVGGTGLYSMSHLHYTAFDPIFYLHHSNTDRLWAIWQALQIRRGKPYESHCAKSLISEGMKPFAFKAPLNNNLKTQHHAAPNTLYNYEHELGYDYDTLQFGGMNLHDLEQYIHNQQKKDRTFAAFKLGGIKTSANVDVIVSKEGGGDYKAGTFSILGGDKEMPWEFDRPYMFEITDALTQLGISHSDAFTVKAPITEYDGKALESSLLHEPYIIFKPGHVVAEDEKDHLEVRKNVDTLTTQEMNELRNALQKLQADTTTGGFQTIAAYHGQPNWCPSPEAEVKFACCVHGMATFPHWHRLLTVQFENGLKRHGYDGAVPYWDWTRMHENLPELVRDATYTDPESGDSKDNSWFKGHIDEANTDTSRTPDSKLFEKTSFDEYSNVARQMLLALEQDDFCSFEVHYEIAHNLIHALVGGNNEHSMASLRYTAYDPIFFLHHSMTDRIWAVWQALQKYRGKPYNSANCDLAEMRKPLKPFALSDVNPDQVTKEASIPFHAFNYESNFGYTYDTLDFHGLSVAQLARELDRIRSKERVFAGFMLHGIKKTAMIKFSVCEGTTEANCKEAGEFYILGDEYEMPWRYNILYKYEITHTLEDMKLRHDDVYHIIYTIYSIDGTELGTDQFGTPTVVLDKGSAAHGEEYVETILATSHVRKNLAHLNDGEIESIRAAFKVIHDDGTYENIAQYHGFPGLCDGLACCIHGMPAFPHWHRLYVLQVEDALLKHGSSTGVPYWDWTIPVTEIPHILSDATYYNSRQQRYDTNPFFSGHISQTNAVTSRDPRPELFNSQYFYENTLLAFEQDNFCDFEIQFEVTHNAFHLWLGGKANYSMSTLEYSAFDPAFFVYHANTDRLWAIWQELQRYRNKPYHTSNCAINEMHVPLKPFDRQTNPNPLTKRVNKPADVFDYQNNLFYRYDTLEFNHMNIPQLEDILVEKQKHDRTFVGVMIHGIKSSAEVTIYVCVPTGKGEKNCNHKAGVFTLLGGPLEMPFTFDRLYKYDITPTLKELGVDLHSHSFDVKLHVETYTGTVLSEDSFGTPTILFVPGSESHQHENGHSVKYVVRKNIRNLSPQETIGLVKALKSMQADTSADGYQSIASFHALPPLCPSPAAAQRFACCVHGMATFPQWHRLYTVQFGESLMKHGSSLCIPYWDWSEPQTSLPDLLTKDSFTDPETGLEISNPWKAAQITFENAQTARDLVSNKLFPDVKDGYRTWYYDQVMFALEQENYCDFEVQYEILHNGIHLWMGGKEEHSMSHLHYTSYDPAFYIHHSETDRIWAIWQELQKYRGLDGNEANCALELMKTPLKPFNFGAPYNLNQRTKEYSKPADTFNYKEHFGYIYDSLEFMGMSVPMLDTAIKTMQGNDRVFAGFLLKGFGKSAEVDFQVCDANNKCEDGGYFSVLGGSQEMPWQFDRLYKYDITHAMDKLGLHHDDIYSIVTTVKDVQGTVLHDVLGSASTIFVPGKDTTRKVMHSHNSIRRDIAHLENRAKQNLISSLSLLQDDDSADGFAAISAFHGLPAQCPDPSNPKYACCIHGMPSFPLWHRLYVRQFEIALKRHGSFNAVPYWDWTNPITDLPSLLTDPSYYDAVGDKVIDNPWAHGYIPTENTHTVRDLQDTLYKTSADRKHSVLFDQVLLALEQTDYCDFEVQLEVVHNWIHTLVGGKHEYSLSSLHWTSYDPLFFIHHSFVDKLFAVWQELQKRRNLPHDRADCAVHSMNTPMHPFNMDININAFTKAHALPSACFKYENLGYSYDNLDVGGMNLDELEHAIEEQKHKTRVFAGFLLHGIGTSAEVHFEICKSEHDCHEGGMLFILGGSKEMPWAYDRLFKYDITDTLEAMGIHANDVFASSAPFHLKVDIADVDGHKLPVSNLPTPTIIYEPAHESNSHGDDFVVSDVEIRKDVERLSPDEIKNLRDALAAVMADHGPNGFQDIAQYHGSPPLCELEDGTKVSCCFHGMATFPHWHRIYITQLEDAMAVQGAKLGIPYWDWTKAFTHLPSFVTDYDNNPFHHGKIEYLDRETTRAPRPQLFSDPSKGEKSFFYDQMLLALEQTDFCSFEVQFEVSHNAIHSWTGGHSFYGMSTLDFASYDPLFYIVHTGADRIWAIWQALQQYRGLPYNEAYCEIQELKEPMSPFSDPVNPNPRTRKFSTPSSVFDYTVLNYEYDDLKFDGMTISELEDLLNARKEYHRVFVDFLLTGFKKSADVEFDICATQNKKRECKYAGTFAILGGPYEMDWTFDRLFRYDVTNTMHEMDLRHDSDIDIVVRVFGIDGTQLDSNLIHPPTMEYVGGKAHESHSRGKESSAEDRPEHAKGKVFRKEVSSLSLDEANELRSAMRKMQHDTGSHGFEHIASFHGAPYLCPEQGDQKYACCMHGMAVFPHWHRLLTVQFENALEEHGSTMGIPYWDWTIPFKSLPLLIGDNSDSNSFYHYHIAHADENTQRAPLSRMYNSDEIYKTTIEMLFEDNYCDFEVQYEMLHNLIHYFVGGAAKFSMSTLEYSAFDPFFMIHHASIDRLWIIWDHFQQWRNKPYTHAECAGKMMHMPLQPFSYASVNNDEVTHRFSHPDDVFNQENFDYWYDSLDLHGQTVRELFKTVQNLKNHTRTYAGFVISGVKATVLVSVFVKNSAGDEVAAGDFLVFGGEREIPWAYERLYKHDITHALTHLHLERSEVPSFRTSMAYADGTPFTASNFPDPLLVVRPEDTEHAHTEHEHDELHPLGVDHYHDKLTLRMGAGVHIPPKISIKRGTHITFHPIDDSVKSVIDLGSYTTFHNCVIPPFGYNSFEINKSYSLHSGEHYFTAASEDQCKQNLKIQIHVDDY